MALFEVLSFKGWLDVRDVLIKALGSVSHHLFDTSIQTVNVYHKNCLSSRENIVLVLRVSSSCASPFLASSFYLHTHLHFPWLHDRLDIVRGRRDRELFWEQGYCSSYSWSETMASNYDRISLVTCYIYAISLSISRFIGTYLCWNVGATWKNVWKSPNRFTCRHDRTVRSSVLSSTTSHRTSISNESSLPWCFLIVLYCAFLWVERSSHQTLVNNIFRD
jgi:hypothetical protein